MVQPARLETLYQHYLESEDTATFIAAVSKLYTVATLCRLAEFGDRGTRRAATMALGLLGDYRVNDVLGRGLRDADRGVRFLSENWIREVWWRDGTEQQRRTLRIIIRLNSSGQCSSAVRKASELIDEMPSFAEAWNQRAIGYYQLGQFTDSANDCHQALELNAYHFGAAVGMGQCYLEMGESRAALECFRRGLRLHPGMEDVRAQIEHLERALEGS